MQGSTALSQWTAAGSVRRLAGHDIFVRTAVAAGKPPLLLVHGYPTASYDWHRVWAPLAAHYSLYACDLLGFGLSEKPAGEPYLISTQADICQALLAEGSVDDAHVLAHDYGDTVAQELLAREREGRLRLGSVCLLNGGLFPEVHRARLVQKLLAAPVVGPIVARGMNERGFARTLRSICGPTPPSPGELHDLWLLMERNGGKRALGRLIGYMEQRRRQRERWVGALVVARVPLKLICGAVDPISGAHMARRYRELVPGADVTLLAEVGHYPQLEAPDRVVEAYLAFRSQCGAAPR